MKRWLSFLILMVIFLSPAVMPPDQLSAQAAEPQLAASQHSLPALDNRYWFPMPEKGLDSDVSSLFSCR